ncbi:MAG: DUF4381 domain-containing protein [Paracoccaceae bacterium]|nr:DUF4381 domain-containing protein [Paracoccaceae bacterium]
MTQDVAPDPITLVDLIDRLVLPPEPAPVSMIPQTVGWIALAVFLAMSIVVALLYWHKKRGENAYRRAALSALQTVGNDPVAVAGILRRTALVAFPRTDVASLSGADWLAFLDETAGGDTFRQGSGQILAYVPYQQTQCDPRELTRIAESWIRHHRHQAHQ